MRRLNYFSFIGCMFSISLISCNTNTDIEPISKQDFAELTDQIEIANENFFSSPEWMNFNSQLSILDEGLLDVSLDINASDSEIKSFVNEHLDQTLFTSSEEFENTFNSVRDAYLSLESVSTLHYSFIEEYQNAERDLLVSQIINAAFNRNPYNFDVSLINEYPISTEGGNPCMDCLTDADYCRRDANESYAYAFGGAGVLWYIAPVVSGINGTVAYLQHRRAIRTCVRNLHFCWDRNDCGE